MNKEEIVKYQTTYFEWLDSLNELSEETSSLPYSEGKWSPKEILMHMAEWDRFTYEDRLPTMKENAKLQDEPFEEFNTKAAALAKSKTFGEIIDYAKTQRQLIVEALRKLPEEELQKPFTIADHELTIAEYFADFAWHDEHHQKQIETVRQ